MQITFLDLDHVQRIHQSMLESYGGLAGVRDVGLLESAIAQPQARFGDQYLHVDLFEMAAAYLYHIVKNHPLVDGNKRTGAACAIIFLAMNHVNLKADEEGLVEITLKTAQGQADKQELAAFFQSIME